jgi:hypothetical protein
MLSSVKNNTILVDMRLCHLEKALVEGPPGEFTLCKLNIHSAPVRGQQLLDEGNSNLAEAF